MHTAEDVVEAYHRGLEYLDYNEPDQAIAAFSAAIVLRPKHAHAWFARGYARSMQGDLDEAIADYSEAIRLDPHFVAAYFNRAAVYREKGEIDKAQQDQAAYERHRLQGIGDRG